MSKTEQDITKNLQHIVRSAVAILLSENAYPGEQLTAANQLFDALSLHTGMDDINPSDNELIDSWVDGGRAISPREAARCTREYLRTTRFIQGIHQAINDLLKVVYDEPVQLLYAGTGPFGTLVLPLLHYWGKEQIQVTLIDYHEFSIDSLKKVASLLGVESHIKNYIQGNAIEYACSEESRPHILVTETMAQALSNETQVAISKNLVPQLRVNGVLIPQQIDISAVLTDTSKCFNGDGNNDIVDIGVAMTLNKENASNAGECFKLKYKNHTHERNDFFYRTTIQVYKDIYLRDNNCSLNIFVNLDLPEQELSKNHLKFNYTMEPKPRLTCTWA